MKSRRRQRCRIGSSYPGRRAAMSLRSPLRFCALATTRRSALTIPLHEGKTKPLPGDDGRQGFAADGWPEARGAWRDLGVTPRTRAAIKARDLGSGKLK